MAYRIEDGAALQRVERRREGALDRGDIGIGMGRRQEAGIAVLHMDAELAHLRPEQGGERPFGREVHVEPARIGFEARRESAPLQLAVQPFHQPAHARGESLLQRRPFGLEMQQHSLAGRERQRMAHEGAGEEGRRRLGDRVVAVAPHAAVERVHEARLAGQDADWHTAAHHLAVGRHIGSDVEYRLHAARMDAETGDDLVEHQRRAAGLGERSQLLQEFLGPEVGMAALHRLDHDGGDLLTVGLDPVEAAAVAIRQHRHVSHGLGRNARRHRHCGACRTTARLHQHLVELAMIVVGEHHDALASRNGARHAHRGHHRLGAGVAEGDALVAGHLGNQCRDLAGQRALRADREAVPELRHDRLGHEVGRVAEHGLAVAVHQVHIVVAVDVADLRALGAGRDHRIDEFFPLLAEARGGARIGQHRSVALRLDLGERRTLVDLAHQHLDIVALGVAQRARHLGRGRPVEPHPRLAIVGWRRSSGGARGLGLWLHRIGRQGCVEMAGEGRCRRHVLQELAEGDPHPELALDGARDLAQQQ